MRGAILLAFALAACDGAEVTRLATSPIDLPAMRSFTAAPAAAPRIPNAVLAQDFMDLTFRMESGRALPIFTRFEGPVTVRLIGAGSERLATDLDGVIGRIRAETGIDISRAEGEASITVETVRGNRLRAAVPNAACFVSPGVASWSDYRREQGSAVTDWTALRERTRIAIFIPDDAPPQEARDCLHEELAQALGPVNDLYRLESSVFNDDNVHAVLTGFDMAMLRIAYAPELRSGMTERQVGAALPAVMARLFPRGGRTQAVSARNADPAWDRAIEDALAPAATPMQRQAAARLAVRMAERNGWRDGRAGFANYLLGRLALADRPAEAIAAFQRAGAIYGSRPGMELHEAHVGMQLAAFALSSGDAPQVLNLTNRFAPVAQTGQNAALLATLLAIRAEALDMVGRPDEAASVREEAFGWARYGFGAEDSIRMRMDEIAALRPGP